MQRNLFVVNGIIVSVTQCTHKIPQLFKTALIGWNIWSHGFWVGVLGWIRRWLTLILLTEMTTALFESHTTSVLKPDVNQKCFPTGMPSNENAFQKNKKKQKTKKNLNKSHKNMSINFIASVRNAIFSVRSSPITEHTNICYVSPVQADDSFVVCGQRAGQGWWLVRHKLKDGAKLDRVALSTVPAHAQEVILNAHLTVAVSYR